MNFRFVKPGFLYKVSQDISVIIFNYLLRFYGEEYDLLIDSGNSQIFLPRKQLVLSYVHFPRKWRILSDFISIHEPDKKIKKFSTTFFFRIALRLIYHLSKIPSDRLIVCNSIFTNKALEESYGVLKSKPYIVYPPVDISKFQSGIYKRENSVATLGRFTSSKRQLEQIKIAERVPDTTFHLIGFISSSNYFKKCQNYIREHGVSNVQLHPNVPYEEVVRILQHSKYFLHTLINEPFGITPVQAISAGCIPIVHDSGGQKETVPVTELRFHELDEIVGIINKLEEKAPAEIENLISGLQEHVTKNFDHSVFLKRMTDVLKDAIGIK